MELKLSGLDFDELEGSGGGDRQRLAPGAYDAKVGSVENNANQYGQGIQLEVQVVDHPVRIRGWLNVLDKDGMTDKIGVSKTQAAFRCFTGESASGAGYFFKDGSDTKVETSKAKALVNQIGKVEIGLNQKGYEDIKRYLPKETAESAPVKAEDDDFLGDL